MEEGGATVEKKALALALTYIPGYSNHLENVTDLGPAEEGQSWGPCLGRIIVGGCDEEILLISISYLTPAQDHFYLPATPTPDYLFGAFTLIPSCIFFFLNSILVCQ